MREVGSIQSYLSQISRRPLLTRGDEIALAKRLDECRKRLYRGILATGTGLQAVTALLHPVCRGAVRVDHVVELAKPGANERRRVLEYVRSAAALLQGLLAENQADFALMTGEGQPVQVRRSASRRLLARRAKAARLLEEDYLPPATPAADPGGPQADFATARRPLPGSGPHAGRPPPAGPRGRTASRTGPADANRAGHTFRASPPSRPNCSGTTGIRSRALRVLQRQSPVGRFHRQTLQQLRPGLSRPDPGGQRRPDAGRRSLRPHAGIHVFHLRHLVDSSGDSPGHRRSGPVHSSSGGRGQPTGQGPVDRHAAVPSPRFSAERRGNGGGGGLDGKRGLPHHAMGRAPLSLDQPINERQDYHLGEFVQDHREDDPLQGTNQELLRSRISEGLQRLDHRERAIIRLRYGFVDGRSHSLQDLGEMFGVTKERARQIEIKRSASYNSRKPQGGWSGFSKCPRRVAPGWDIENCKRLEFPHQPESASEGMWLACGPGQIAVCRFSPATAGAGPAVARWRFSIKSTIRKPDGVRPPPVQSQSCAV